MRTHSTSHFVAVLNIALTLISKPTQPLSHFANSTSISSLNAFIFEL